MLSSGSTRIVIDIGPDFRQQLLTAGVDDVDAILLTHEHNDHVSGLDEIRPINFIRKKDIPVFGQRRVLKELTLRFPYVFDVNSEYPGRPKVNLVEINTEVFTVGDIEVRPIRIMHGPLPILGYRVGDFCYITDAKTIAPEELDKLRGLDTLIINALHRRPHFSHLNLKEATDLIAHIGPRQAYLTHLSHDMGRHAAVESELPAAIRLAYDGQVLQMSPFDE